MYFWFKYVKGRDQLGVEENIKTDIKGTGSKCYLGTNG
jgi:hypothetical protein